MGPRQKRAGRLEAGTVSAEITESVDESGYLLKILRFPKKVPKMLFANRAFMTFISPAFYKPSLCPQLDYRGRQQ